MSSSSSSLYSYKNTRSNLYNMYEKIKVRNVYRDRCLPATQRDREGDEHDGQMRNIDEDFRKFNL